MMIQPESEQITAHTPKKNFKKRSNRTTDTHMRQPGLEINVFIVIIIIS